MDYFAGPTVLLRSLKSPLCPPLKKGGAGGLHPGGVVFRRRAWHLNAVLVAALSILFAARATAFEFRDARPGYRFAFPRDHASHDSFKTEWWYYSGVLRTNDGRRFGYQLTFFRSGVDPAAKNPSRWTVRHLYLAHFAVSDATGRRHAYFEKMNRAGIAFAGARSDRYHVWNEDWSAGLN
ncbi:MAG: carotenoid 1,2-hydratase, partial [Nitrospirae bacterium]|nr:carotenoid 1,2-hydratase [Nitrospirota bacterium]